MMVFGGELLILRAMVDCNIVDAVSGDDDKKWHDKKWHDDLLIN